MHDQVCPGVHRSQAGQCYVGGSVARVFIVGFRFCPTVCCDGFVIRFVCSVSLVLARSRDAGIYWTRVYLRNAPVHALGPGRIKLKPEDIQKQVGKLAEEYGALVDDVTLWDGFTVLQVELFTDIKFLRFLK